MLETLRVSIRYYDASYDKIITIYICTVSRSGEVPPLNTFYKQ